MLTDWIYVHIDETNAAVTSTLNTSVELEGISSLVHEVQAGPSATNSIDVMGWSAGITNNTVLVRTCFKFVFDFYGVYAIVQDPSLLATRLCYAATYDSQGRVRLWKATLQQIMLGAINPIKTVFLPTTPSHDTWGISLLCQYDSGQNVMQLTVETTNDAVVVPIVEAQGQFPVTSPRMVVLDSAPLSGGFNAGPFSIQNGVFIPGSQLDDFDVTQIFTG